MRPTLLLKLLFLLLILLCLKTYSANKLVSIDSLQSGLKNAMAANEKSKACSIAHQLSVQLWINGKVDSSLIYSMQTFDLATELKDTSFQVKGLTNCAYNCQQKGDFKAAVNFFEKAILLSERSKDTLQWANSIENMSTIYGATGLTNYPKALELLLKAAKLKEDFKAYTLLPGTYKNISAIFKEVKDTLNREKYLLKAVTLVDEGKAMNPTFQAAVYNEAGRFYTDERVDFSKADAYFNRVLEISKKLEWKKGISASLSNLANVKELQGDYPNALLLLSDVLKIKTEINDFYGLVNTHYSIGDIYFRLKNFGAAIENFMKARDLSLQKNMSNELNKSYQGLYKAFKESGKYQTALEYYEKSSALSDSISGANHRKAVAELETKYQSKQKEQQIEQLTSEKQIETLKARQRNLVVFILAALLLVSALLGYLIFRQKSLNNQKRESELNQKLLRSQMNPHFIFNALGTIQNYIYNNRPDDAGKYLAKFAKLMRNILESSINEQIPIDQEIETVTNYLTLQQIRSNNHFQFEVIVDGSQHDEQIPPMLAQPFIENAIKHAFKPDDLDGKITVSYVFGENGVSIIIEDNGVGINSTTNKNEREHKSYAIQLTCERLRLFNRQNRKSSSINIYDLSETGGKGTKVKITFKQI
jgi:tetratricopeptide (TPR) repeat protein